MQKLFLSHDTAGQNWLANPVILQAKLQYVLLKPALLAATSCSWWQLAVLGDSFQGMHLPCTKTFESFRQKVLAFSRTKIGNCNVDFKHQIILVILPYTSPQLGDNHRLSQNFLELNSCWSHSASSDYVITTCIIPTQRHHKLPFSAAKVKTDAASTARSKGLCWPRRWLCLLWMLWMLLLLYVTTQTAHERQMSHSTTGVKTQPWGTQRGFL